MVSGMLLAFSGAALADFGAHPAGLGMQIAAAHQQPGREGAGVGAVTVKAHAPGHHLDVVLSQTGRGAVFAGGKAVQAGVDAGLQFRTDIHLHGHLNLRGEDLSIGGGLSEFCKSPSRMKVLTMEGSGPLKLYRGPWFRLARNRN